MQTYAKGSNSISYKYDENGLRTEKVVNGVKYQYYYVGDRLVYEQKGNEYALFYRYDEAGQLSMVIKYQYSNSKGYFYNVVSNAQGDIIELRNGAEQCNPQITPRPSK